MLSFQKEDRGRSCDRRPARHSAPIFLDCSDALASKEPKSSVASNSGMKNLDAASAMRSSVVRFGMQESLSFSLVGRSENSKVLFSDF